MRAFADWRNLTETTLGVLSMMSESCLVSFTNDVITLVREERNFERTEEFGNQSFLMMSINH